MRLRKVNTLLEFALRQRILNSYINLRDYYEKNDVLYYNDRL